MFGAYKILESNNCVKIRVSIRTKSYPLTNLIRGQIIYAPVNIWMDIARNYF